MNKTKFRSITIAALVLLLALTLSIAFGALMPAARASAVEYSASEIFSRGTGGEVTNSTDAAGDRYVAFKLDEEGSVHFRRDLALKWYAKAEGDETAAEGRKNPGEVQYFHLTFAFESLDFEQLSILFESAEENISKESTSRNALIFYSDGTTVTAAVRDASVKKDDEEDWTPSETPVTIENPTSDLKIEFNEVGCDIGEFAVSVNGAFIGRFQNIGGNFMEYLSTASSTPRVPMTFTADKLPEGTTSVSVIVKELNGQSFLLTGSNVVDNAAPVLVINEAIYSYTLGKRWSLTYEAIDVCDSSVNITRRYAMLKTPDEGASYKKPVESSESGSDGDYRALTTSTCFVPTSDKVEEEQYVSIYFDLDDGTSLTPEERLANRIYLSWYAVEDAVATLGEDDEAFDYIKVDRRMGGPSYVGVTVVDAEEDGKPVKKNEVSAEAEENFDAYQKLVDERSHEEKDGKTVLSLSAGDGAYFYLPSLRGIITSDTADYRNLRFSIYYKKPSQEKDATALSATSLRYNALRFEIEEQGKYLFKILATDASSNAMHYAYAGKEVEVTSTNIWDIEEIPTFSLEVGYTGATIEDPGEQPNGYRYTTCTLESFDIVALAGYETEYTLYYFDDSKLSGGKPSYADFVKNAKDYMTRYENCLVKIRTYNSAVTEDDEAAWNRTDNAYHWNPDSSLSFIPQEEDCYYIVKLVVTEYALPGNQPDAYQVINVSHSVDRPPVGIASWIEENLTSVVLFSISAFLLIVIVILFVVKPSDKKVEEVDLESLKGKKKNKKE